MEYEYTKKDRINHPLKYEYTKYHGDEFLTIYCASRKSFIGTQSVEQLEVLKTKIQMYFNNKEYTQNKTSAIVAQAILNMLNNQDKQEVYDKLSMLVKKYEVSKKLYESYDNVQPIGEYNNIHIYILLAIACGMYYSRYKNLKYLNCLLKLNDLIISCNGRINTVEIRELANVSIKLEMLLVRDLACSCGVKFLC